MIKINLVPSEILAKAQQRQRTLQLGLAGAAVAGLLVLVSLAFVARLHHLQTQVAADKGELARLGAIVAKVKDEEALASQLRARLKVIDDLDRGRRAYPYFMSDFVRSVPSGVRVRTMVTTGGGSAALKLNISAEAHSNEDIRFWVHKLEESGRFANVELGPVSTQEGVAVVRDFTLTANYSPQL